MANCWFESFGCNHKYLKSVIYDHLISNMKLHFNLEEIRKLNLEKKTHIINFCSGLLHFYLFSFDSKILKTKKTIIIIIMVKQKTTFVEIQKLKKDIESKDNEIKKMKQEIQVKQKQ
ncbi:hypothetical protein RFI_35018 [Reticulomyxa filosa]|uniref:Uncharacterized protein n=1 Tax=Reticulomyxa filosa TaxID=46433 RepID=X6LKH3_RETFI|nr:hypothetical protein RFI_35018 [Reticulomyxa filosa]|eukprot:ETO02418.1 hypothetical protein RFI_35018 [Reticulomyxa filosa]